MDLPQDEQDRIAYTGERPVNLDNLTEKKISPKDERIVLANPSPDADIIQPARNVIEQTEPANPGGDHGNVLPLNAYASFNQNISYGGYGSGTGAWDGYSQYVNADGLHIVPPVYNDSLHFHSSYGFNLDMAYGQYSPAGTPMSPVMVDGQLFSHQQLPFHPYYPQQAPPGLNHASLTVSIPPTELVAPEYSSIDNVLYGPGPGYFVNYGSFGGGNPSFNIGSGSLTPPGAYSQPMGILGSYEQSIGKVSQQGRPMHGFGFMSSNFGGGYPQGCYQSSNIGGSSITYTAANDNTRFTLDKARGRERERDSISLLNDSHDILNDRNRGPKASKVKGKNVTKEGSSFHSGRIDLSTLRMYPDSCNRSDFSTDYESSRFFIIKSFSEDNVHKSIKYKVWASTPHGNKKLDAAYHEAKEIRGSCPIFLFFSVNASGQFCGVAEMVGSVDFEKKADCWQQDRWSGQFPVQWHFIKDVPNMRFRHVLLENNDNKPVSHSRDSQEVKLKQGIEMLKIFKDYDAHTSILDDFDFYDERERNLKERKARQQQPSNSVAVESINQMSQTFSQALQLNDSEEEVIETERDATLRMDNPLALVDNLINQTSN